MYFIRAEKNEMKKIVVTILHRIINLFKFAGCSKNDFALSMPCKCAMRNAQWNKFSI